MQEVLKFLSDLSSQITNLDPISLVNFLLKILIYPLTFLNTYFIFREKIRRPKLSIDVEYSAFLRREIFLDLKIDLTFISRNEDVYLREIYIFNKPRFSLIRNFNQLWFESFTYYPYEGPKHTGNTWKFDFQPPVRKISIRKAVKNDKCKESGDISDQNIEIFRDFKEYLWEPLRVEDWEQGIAGLKIPKNSTLTLTIVGELSIAGYRSEEEYINSSRKISKSGWYLACDYSVGKVIKKLPLRTRNV